MVTMPNLILVLLCNVLPALLLTGYPALMGIKALSYSTGEDGEQATTLRMLGIHLLEPLVTLLTPSLISLLYALAATVNLTLHYWILRNFSLGLGLLALTPMLALLLPARGFGFSDPDCRRICRQLTYLGGARLLGYAFIVLGMQFIVGIVVTFVAFCILCVHIAPIIRKRTYPRSPATQPLVPPASATPAFTSPRLPRTTVTAFCPVCQEPTGLHDQDCPACGLLFTSRVPPVLRALADYTVLRPLAQGGMGSVYLSQARRTAQLCVIKTLASVDGATDRTWHADAAGCLAREAELLAQIQHPHIPRLLEVERQGGLTYLALEYIPGPTVEQRLSHTTTQGVALPGAPFPPAEALPLIARVAATLADLAELPRPLMHLDIKPANLILPLDRPAPLLVDFGSAAWIADVGASATGGLGVFGTPGYAAPEQYAGQASPLSDCYGLAATLYHMLTDDDPGAHPLAFPAMATLPADIAALLNYALDRDPARRPTIRALSARLELLAARYATETVAATSA